MSVRRYGCVSVCGRRRIITPLTVERQEHEPKHVGRGEQRREGANRPQQRMPRDERLEEDLVLAEEAGQRKYTGNGDRADQERPIRERQLFLETTHVADVLLAVQRMDDGARAEEEQRLEEGVS